MVSVAINIGDAKTAINTIAIKKIQTVTTLVA